MHGSSTAISQWTFRWDAIPMSSRLDAVHQFVVAFRFSQRYHLCRVPLYIPHRNRTFVLALRRAIGATGRPFSSSLAEIEASPLSLLQGTRLLTLTKKLEKSMERVCR